MIFVDTGFFFARIYRTSFEEQLDAFAYLKQHEDKGSDAMRTLETAHDGGDGCWLPSEEWR